MRARPLALLSTIAVSALLLTGCAGDSSPEPSPSTSDAAANADPCTQAVASGALTDSVKIEGEFGTPSTATFDQTQEVSDLQRTVVSEGDGADIEQGEYVAYAMSAFDAATGERLGDLGYADAEVLPQNVLANQTLAQVIGCVPIGSRIAAAFPAQEGAQGAQVYIIDVLRAVPTAAWGEPQAPVDGMPAVELAKDGEPSITMPKGDAPTGLKISVLKQGDGVEVADGDTTLLQYYGADWADGESFDSSWSKGEPLALPGNTYVPGFVQALAGQKVGSQVLVVIPPALGYGEDPDAHELGGKTLVFVVDILATMHAPAQQ
ncbi:FKBP-type peptidyl-prolyl cis-trans isomerase [Microbacterium suwonense]|uniref:Peptidyl-prolyl cis-trans isomerase n=1 Tax=Microbacterium suwonense TaxID=683047 RepID=A0ABM8FSX5_9MICO|nr:FKBP-type peptidyl-prolyl cis-trans isomerase [Microbacterium suwonense]BDZ38634.1 peptidylprolyl isomerase [Microbacterium suwonense]